MTELAIGSKQQENQEKNDSNWFLFFLWQNKHISDENVNSESG